MFRRLLIAAVCALASAAVSPAQSRTSVTMPYSASGTVSTAYSGSATYYIGNLVSSGGCAYTPLTQGISGVAPSPTSSSWQLLGCGPFTLTTNGTSGPATLQNGVLNIPQYAATGGGTSPAGYTDAGSSLSSALSSCTSTNGLQISQGIAVSSNVTVPSTCALRFVPGGELLPASGVVVTFAGGGSIQAPSHQHIFGGAGTVAGLKGVFPAEWWGAVGDGTSSCTGTDNTAYLQAAINSIQSGHIQLGPFGYLQSGTITITSPAVGLWGTQSGYTYPSSTPVSVLLSNSATATQLAFQGGGYNTNVEWNDSRDFSVQRCVAPSGSATSPSSAAKGISLVSMGGTTLSRVQVQDSIIGIYLNNVPSNSLGFEWTGAGNGNTPQVPASAYSSSQELVGLYMDSANGLPMNSFTSFMGGYSNATPAKAIGVLISGTALNDVDMDGFNSAGADGVVINCTGTCVNSSDLKFRNMTIDEFPDNGISITGVTASSYGAISFEGGLLASQNSNAQYSADIENSSGIIITGVQMNNAAGQGGVMVHNSSSVNVAHNLLYNVAGTPLACSTCSATTFDSNSLRDTGSVSAPVMIGTASATRNVFTNNTATGNVGVMIGLDPSSMFQNVVFGNIANNTSGGAADDPFIQLPASGSTTNAGFSFASTVTDGCKFSASNFVGFHFVVGSATSGIVTAYDPTNNAGCISAITPGVAWRNLQLQEWGGFVGVGTQGTQPPNARFAVGLSSTPDPHATTQLNANSANQQALVLQAKQGQTADLLDVEDYQGNIIGSINASGAFSGGSTASAAATTSYATPTTSSSGVTLASDWNLDDHAFLVSVNSSSAVSAGTAFALVTFGKTWYDSSGNSTHPICSVTPVGLGSYNAGAVATTVSSTQIGLSTINGLSANTGYGWMVLCEANHEQ